jgi:hypothetical protein
MIVELPDSRYSLENLSEIDTNSVCDLNEAAEKMAFFPSAVPGLNDAWKAAYDATQAELMRRIRARKAV